MTQPLIQTVFEQAVRWKRVTTLGIGFVGILLWFIPADTAQAGRWMYRRSYFSDGPQAAASRFPMPPLRSRSAYRQALVGRGYGFAIRGGYRYNHIVLRSGQSTDRTVIREDWFEVRP